MQCKSNDCVEQAERRGYCGRHYAQLRRAGGLPGSKACSMSGCENASVSLGYCPNHYEKFRRCGDPAGRKNYGQGATHPLYPTWRGIRVRTGVIEGADDRARHYKNVGMCDRWKDDFWAFVEDMGPRPSRKHSIDRIDNAKGYSVDNCRWATKSEQVWNRRLNKLTHTLIKQLRRRYDNGESALSLSKECELSYDVVRLCVTRRTWKNI